MRRTKTPLPSRSASAPAAERPAEARTAVLLPRLRVLCGDEIALGPGKAALLAAIDECGCLAEAARSLEMSYMRAWKLVKTMNACFREPLVVAHRGGSVHGTAALTAAGSRALALYRQMEAASLDAMDAAWEALRPHLK